MKISKNFILFCLILFLGIFARVWEFPALPAGLNQDEASSGVDAYNLLHYGVDTNGQSFPVHAIAYGSGQNIPYTYLLIPFIALGGLSPFTARLPMLLLGILCLPLVFYLGRRTINTAFGLLAMFFIAISPWNIMMARWGLDSNILPYIALAGFVLILKSDRPNFWLVPAFALLGLSLYAYGSAYVFVPILAVLASLILVFSKRVSWRALLLSWLTLGLVAIPIGLFVLVNYIKWDSIHLGLMTIPRLPSGPRFESMVAFSNAHVLHTLKENTLAMFNLLWVQTDSHIFNVVAPYGYFYTWSTFLAIIGAFGLLPVFKTGQKTEKLLLLAWLLACLPIGMLEPLTLNRFNIIFFPLIISMAVPFAWLQGRLRILLWPVVLVFLLAFAAFTRDYHSPDYASSIGRFFYDGLIPALESLPAHSTAPVCVTDQAAEPYIYVLFVDHTPPSEFLSGAHFEDPQSDFRFVNHFGRYTFRLKDCPPAPQTIYVLGEKETPPDTSINYQVEEFTNFRVFRPQ